MMKYLDPLYWLGEDGYRDISQQLVYQIFNGNLARVLSACLLALGMWFVFRRKLTGAGLGLVGLAVLIIFSQSIMRIFNFNLF